MQGQSSKKHIVHFALCITTLCAYGQADINYRTFGEKDGMAPAFGDLAEILQDKKGFIWFSGEVALNRFDGFNFRVYQHDPDDSLLNFGPQILGDMLTDGEGNLWINGMSNPWENGRLLKYDYQLDGFLCYYPELPNAFINRNPNGESAITFEHDHGTIWIGGSNGAGLFSFDTHSQITRNFLSHDANAARRKAQNTIISISDRHHRLILTTDKGVWIFDKAKQTFARPQAGVDSMWLDGRFTFIGQVDEQNRQWMIDVSNYENYYLIDSAFAVVEKFKLEKDFLFMDLAFANGAFWFLCKDGVYKYSPVDRRLTNTKKIYGLPQDIRLRKLSIDKDGNIWLIGDEAYQLLEKQLPIFSEPAPANINSAASLSNGDDHYLLLLSTFNKAWLAKFHGPDSIVLAPFSFKGQHDKHSNFIRHWKGKSHLWIATWGRGIVGLPIGKTGMVEPHPVKYFEHDPSNINTLSTNETWDVYEDDQENLWVATFAGLNKVDLRRTYGEEGSVTRYYHRADDSTSISTDIVREIIPEDSQSLWIVTETGVDLFNNGKFKHVFHDRETPNSIIKASTGVVYVGTHGGLYEAKNEEGKYVFRKNPHVSESIRGSIQEDKTGRIWIPVWEKGGSLICYDPSRATKIAIGRADGLAAGGYLNTIHDGRFFFAGRTNFSVFNPLELQTSTKQNIPALVNVWVNNKIPPVSPIKSGGTDFHLPENIVVAKEIVLDHTNNNFTIEFSALEMTSPETILYRHKLEGFDADWIESDDKNRTATYMNLAPGRYQFRIKASNHHGVWFDHERRLSVVILPPPWKTWWAYTCYLLALTALLLFARRSIVQRERLKSSLRIATIEKEKEHFELQKAREIDRVKTSFFTNISHEFRTPLTLIKAPVQELQEQFPTEPQIHDKLRLVERSANLLLGLVNQLLDLAKLESGMMKIHKEWVEVNSFVSAIIEGFQPAASQNAIALEQTSVAETIKAFLDKEKVETILSNLLSNAIKFTPAGGSITLSSALLGDRLFFSVADTGVGIPADQQTRIFERFQQVSESHRELGTGIGLSLVKELTELMGGTIVVESNPGGGSHFTVALPVAVGEVLKLANLEFTHQRTIGRPVAKISYPVNTAYLDGSTENSSGNDSAKPHILLVEDHDDLRRFIMNSLGNRFCFLEARNGKEGLEFATTHCPDMIISDVMMPEMDGITMAAMIRRDIRTSHIPLILLTAKVAEESMLLGLHEGADDYLTKPFNTRELLLKIQNIVARQQRLREKLRGELLSAVPKVEVLSENERFMNKVKETILQHLADEQLGVASLAESIGLSRVQLYRKISALTGLSANELIRKLRLHKASQLLAQKWGPVSQVAYEVGFSNLSYFSKAFKEEYGVLPSQYPTNTLL